DIYVQPSRYEGFGLAVQEARILGKPVAASDIACIKEQITDGRNGLLFAFDERDMADAVSKLLEDHVMQRRFHEACEQESFDFSDQLDKLWELMR
ncbi:glycosyltransferase, partial [Bifidobacterium sp.]|uniref:glycosyltransferase n=1 Tax=Bifidobacterium sp. TaxID=41200 RepID=UPI002A90952A